MDRIPATDSVESMTPTVVGIVKVVLISVLAWAAAIAYYAVIGLAMTSKPDVLAFAFWGGIVMLGATPIAFVPAMGALQLKARAWWHYPVVSGLLGAVPVVLFAAMWSGGHVLASLSGLLSGVGLFFLSIFAVFGVMFGLGFFFGFVRGRVH